MCITVGIPTAINLADLDYYCEVELLSDHLLEAAASASGVEESDLQRFLADLRADQAAWEQEHFGDDQEARKAHYDYCLRVAMGFD